MYGNGLIRHGMKLMIQNIAANSWKRWKESKRVVHIYVISHIVIGIVVLQDLQIPPIVQRVI